jgi:hypothetical protein
MPDPELGDQVEEQFGDVVFQLRDDILKNGWTPGRGDYGADHSSDIIALIEEHNCVHGCTRAGTAAERKEFGPGGNCSLLASVAAGGIPIPELEPRRAGPYCTVRHPPPPKPPPKPRRKAPPKDVPPLF